jgi:hypothetical protein
MPRFLPKDHKWRFPGCGIVGPGKPHNRRWDRRRGYDPPRHQR